MSDKLEDLIDRYFDIAYQQGKEGRNHDDIEGSAQATLDAIKAEIEVLRTPAPSTIAMGIKSHVGHSLENDTWFVRVYPFESEEKAKEAQPALTAQLQLSRDMQSYIHDLRGAIAPFAEASSRYDKHAPLAIAGGACRVSDLRIAKAVHQAEPPALAEHPVGGDLWAQLVVLSGYHITRPPTPDHEFVQVCNGDLRKMVELMGKAPAPAELSVGLSAWSGWDKSNLPWSEAKHKDAVCRAVFGDAWAVEDAAALIGFIETTWRANK